MKKKYKLRNLRKKGEFWLTDEKRSGKISFVAEANSKAIKTKGFSKRKPKSF